MLERLGGAMVRRRWSVLAATAVLVIVAAVFGSGVFGAVKSRAVRAPPRPARINRRRRRRERRTPVPEVLADHARSERIVFPVSAVGLLLVFGSAVAAALPVLVGVIAIVATLAVLHALALMTDVSVYSINLTTALGLGLAVDYSLFVVSRYREELRRNGGDHTQAGLWLGVAAPGDGLVTRLT